MSGFFSSQQFKNSTRKPDGKSYTCISCGLHKAALSPKMRPFGNFKLGILNIGEAPGEQEDKQGKQWQGRTGRLLQNTYEKLGIDLFEDCLNINAVNCRPTSKDGHNRTPSGSEIACCRNLMLDKVIKEYQPKLIMLFGGCAVESILSNSWKGSLGGIMKWRGLTIPDREYKAWVCPVFHPSFVERSEGAEVNKIWIDDIENALKKLNEPLPKLHKPKIDVIEDLSALEDIKSDLIAFDYETTGLKPHAAGHKIVSCAVADSPNHCYVFLMPEKKSLREPWIKILQNKSIQKMAHNMQFEEMWSVVRLKQPVKSWFWDSMLATHILDNRPGICGLKFQAYVNLGVSDYSSEIEPYLKSADGESNGFNRVIELIKTKDGLEKLLTYNALDSIYEYRLAMIQLKAINYSFLPF